MLNVDCKHGLIQKICKKENSSCHFFQFLVIKTLDPDPQLEKIMVADPH
jgi:hypothetical protein